MNWIKYLLEANVYLALFYAAYYLLMRRETYYQLNRAYLLSCSVVAFIIPLLQLGFLKPVPEPVQPNMATAFDTSMATYVAGQAVKPPPVAELGINYYLLVYITVAALLAIGFGIRLFQLIKLAKHGKHVAAKNFKLIEIEDDDRAFSFFNYLFIGKKLTASDTIIKHELVHIRQRHSLDIIYLELLKIICWFNPLVYLMQHSIKELHEFIADSQIAASQQDVDGYTDFLIGNAYGLSETALTNNFFNKNLLKTRIMMLHQKRSGGLAGLKYLVALPLLAGMLCLSTLGFTKNYMMIDLAPGHQGAMAGIIHLSAPAPKQKTPIITPSVHTLAYKSSWPRHTTAASAHHLISTHKGNNAKLTGAAGISSVHMEDTIGSTHNQPVVINVPIAKAANNYDLASIAVVRRSKTNRDSVPDSVTVRNLIGNAGERADSAQSKKVLYVTFVRRSNQSSVVGKAETTPLINNSGRVQVTTIPIRVLIRK